MVGVVCEESAKNKACKSPRRVKTDFGIGIFVGANNSSQLNQPGTTLSFFTGHNKK